VSRVVTFGECLAALHGAGPLRLAGSLRLSVAGSESNVAIGLARLGHDVEWIGRVGDDEFGALVLRTLRAEGVDVQHAVVDPSGPTALLVFEHRIADVTRVMYYRAESAGSALGAADVLPGVSDEVAILHVTGVTAALGAGPAAAVSEAVARARSTATTVSLDVNFRSRLWSADAARSMLQPLLDQVDIVFGSAEELLLVADGATDVDTAAGQLLAGGVQTVVAKLGADGAVAFTVDDTVKVPARRVQAVDSVGAGDAFVAGYLSGLLDGIDGPGCLDRGAVLGAFAVSREGDWEALPTRAELDLLDTAPGTTLR
jgi:2-dehydro-3-deoxygluconokinase